MQSKIDGDGSAFKKGDILSFELSSSEFDLHQLVTIEAAVTIDNVKLSAGTIKSIQLWGMHFILKQKSVTYNSVKLSLLTQQMLR